MCQLLDGEVPFSLLGALDSRLVVLKTRGTMCFLTDEAQMIQVLDHLVQIIHILEGAAGQILAIRDSAITVACKSGAVVFRNLVDTHGKPVAISDLVAKHGLDVGKRGFEVLPVPDLPKKR